MPDQNPAADLFKLVLELLNNQEDRVKETLLLKPELKEFVEKIRENLGKEFVRYTDLDENIDNFNKVLLDYAMHNYTGQVDFDQQHDVLSSLATSINLLGEELNHSTITKHYLEDIFNSIPDMLLVVDGFGYIDSINHATSSVLEFSDEELLRKRIELILEEDINIQTLINNEDKRKTFNFITKHGEKIPVSLNISPFVRGDNKKIGSVIIARNISMILKYQKEIEERNEMITIANRDLKDALRKVEESDKLKTAFLQNMSHEIRTPLNVIIGLTQLMNSTEISTDEIAEYSKIIEKSGYRLIEIVNNVLDISKIETGQVEVNQKFFSVNSLLTELHTSFQKEAEERGLSFAYKTFLSDQDSDVYSDSGKLSQVLTNLIKNAFKFTKEGRVDFGYELKDDQIEFFVRDTGVGIAPEYREKIFVRFIQGDSSLTRNYEGAGLGLSISRGLIELLGGKIWVESELGKGSTFYFTIPYVPKEEKKDENKVDLESIGEGIRKLNILIAEDDELNYYYLSSLLSTMGHDLMRAQNGLEAVNLCEDENNKFDIVLMDIKMPVMDGIEATRRIREKSTDLPIIAVTAFAFNEEKHNALNTGFNDYLSKPVLIDNLVKAIKNCLNL